MLPAEQRVWYDLTLPGFRELQQHQIMQYNRACGGVCYMNYLNSLDAVVSGWLQCCEQSKPNLDGVWCFIHFCVFKVHSDKSMAKWFGLWGNSQYLTYLSLFIWYWSLVSHIGMQISFEVFKTPVKFNLSIEILQSITGHTPNTCIECWVFVPLNLTNNFWTFRFPVH